MINYYSFSAFNLKGNNYPTQEIADKYYENSSVSVVVKEGIQEWVVPQSGRYYIEAAGASGIFSCIERVAGKGAKVATSIHLTKDEKIYYLVGQQGYTRNSAWGGAGGGASFIVREDSNSNYFLDPCNANVSIIAIAAGGGGSGDCNDGASIKDGSDGRCELVSEGAGTEVQTGSSGGSGFLTDATKAKSFLNGGKAIVTTGPSGSSYGGFGGGGTPYDSGGGGGGYHGGDSLGVSGAGTCGYSYYDDYVVFCKSGDNEGNGYVTIILANQDHFTNQLSNFFHSQTLLVILSLFIIIK